MKRLILPAALLLSTAVAFSQQAPAPIERQQPDAASQLAPAGKHHGHGKRNPHQQAMMLGKQLNLTPDQTAKLEPILADRQQKLDAIKNNAQLTPQDQRQQLKALHKSEASQLSSVLTPDQIAQMHALHKGAHKRGGNTEPLPAATPQA